MCSYFFVCGGGGGSALPLWLFKERVWCSAPQLVVVVLQISCTQSSVRARTHTLTHTRACTHAHAHTRAHTRTRTHAHTCTHLLQEGGRWTLDRVMEVTKAGGNIEGMVEESTRRNIFRREFERRVSDGE